MVFNCAFDMWSPTIGDPSPMGWVTVISYFFTAVTAFCVHLRLKHSDTDIRKTKTRLFWILMMFLLLFLGVNKQLDLQSLFTMIGKCAAKSEGWYADRRKYQTLFIVTISAIFLVLAIFFVWNFRDDLKNNLIAILGLLFLVFFIILRASSFHKFDLIINYHIYSIRMNWALELAGLFLILLQSIINLAKPGKNKKH